MAISRRGLWPVVGAWLVFMASAAALSATLLARGPMPPLHELHEYHLFDEFRDYRFFDLKVYRRAAEMVSQGRPLYAIRLRHGLGFTYPPIAVLLFLCLRWLPVRGDELAVTIINVTLVAVIAHVSLRLRRSKAERERAPRRYARRHVRLIAAGWLIAAVALWAEPITTTFGYGQIDLLITACVVVDLVYGERSRAGGLGIGLAAALKLTPLVFIPYLVLTGRGRMAVRALGVFLISIGIALLVIPRDATTYWFGGKFMDFHRVTGGNPHAGSGAANQSLRGALLRILPDTSHMTLIWLLASVAVAAVGLLMAVRAARRGDEAWGFMLVALTGLLICPVSWTHHWTIAAAGVIALLGSRGRPALSALKVAAAIAFVAGSSAIWFVIRSGPDPHLGATGVLLGNLYVFIGLAVIAAAAALELRHAWDRRHALHSPQQLRLPQRIRVIPETPVRAITTSQALAPDRQS